MRTKTDIRKLETGKGKERKLYFPDHLIVIGGLPMVVVEVKAPHEGIEGAQREARLYALEINSRYPTGLNPCGFTLVTNGKTTAMHSWDSDAPIQVVDFEEMYAENVSYNTLLETLKRDKQKKRAQTILDSLKRQRYIRPVKQVGGESSRNEELKPNTFGSSLVFNYRHVFNPTSTEERRNIVQNAYIASARRDRHVQSIDRVIRAAAPPSVSSAREIENTETPKEITEQLKDFQKVTNQVLLLIGGVGAGKSTFVDYLQEVALPYAVRDSTMWIRINLNVAPVDKGIIYEWIKDQIVQKLKAANSEHDFDDIEVIKHIYKREIHSLRGVLKLLTVDSPAYNEKLVDAILKLQQDKMATIKGIERFTCSSRSRMLVIVLDNCDKRARDEQLLMFEVAQWIQHEIRCLVLLPIRDVTYDHHRSEPPLDTALKDLVYRIEAPSFQQVIESRIRLAVKEMQAAGLAKTATYGLGENIKVEYATDKLALYLERMRLAFFQQNAFARKVITALRVVIFDVQWKCSSIFAIAIIYQKKIYSKSPPCPITNQMEFLPLSFIKF